MSALAGVLDAIARAVLGEIVGTSGCIGHVTLRDHQRDALVRVQAALREFGGALLADEPGLGKTYVALALAREFAATTVAAPVALRSMWSDAALRAGATVRFVSLETLSRREIDLPTDLVIVDEAHHVCNPGAARYARLARLVKGARVLLLSATPVRNRRSELDAMLALFLGAGTSAMDPAARSRVVIRRKADLAVIPEIDGPHWHAPPRMPDLVSGIRGLPPPLPALDGGEAQALLSMSLARCWASSLAALDAALRRRLQRGAALDAVLDAGRFPTRHEFRAWMVGDDSVQLAFPILAAHAELDTSRMRGILRAHLDAVHKLRDRIAPLVRGDAARRAAFLLSLRTEHPEGRIVAFTAHAATAEAIYRALRRATGVALLTARGARTAGGVRPRDDILAALSGGGGATRSRLDDISLVVATDLLSEGVNLQGASVVVHLDIPWTPAGLEQRVGRAARMGSACERVHVHGLSPSRSAERLLRLESRLVSKDAERVAAVAAAVEMERLRTHVARWRLAVGDRADGARQTGPLSEPRLVATVNAPRAGALAVVRVGYSTLTISGAPDRHGVWTFSEAPSQVSAAAHAAGTIELPTSAILERRARAGAAKWLAARLARRSSGAGKPASRARRLFLERADATVATSPAHARAETAARVVALRARLGAAVSAGAELLLLELARLASSSALAWIDTCERRMAIEAPGLLPQDSPASGEILALLLFSPSPAAPRVVGHSQVARRSRGTRAVST
ncbi:MAG TPA: helicase-related protein [Gemmatimonadaceae bacterium]|nr:helicase-related protein [Gemmatimonadaceae bacterium]